MASHRSERQKLLPPQIKPRGEETVIRYEPEQEQLVIDCVKSTSSGPVSVPVLDAEAYDTAESLFKQLRKRVSEQKAPLKLEEGEALKLHIFLRRSIEAFANGRQAVTQVVYPELEGSTGVRVFSGNESITVRNIQSWTLAETNAY